MSADTLHSNHATARLGRHSIHAMLVPFPLVCFVGALLADLAYWGSDEILWEIFSIWLIAAGVATGVLAMIAGMVDLSGNRRFRAQGVAWVHAFGNLIALALAFVNALVHNREGYTAVVPEGLVLSLLVVLILIGTSLIGRRLADRALVQDARR